MSQTASTRSTCKRLGETNVSFLTFACRVFIFDFALTEMRYEKSFSFRIIKTILASVVGEE